MHGDGRPRAFDGRDDLTKSRRIIDAESDFRRYGNGHRTHYRFDEATHSVGISKERRPRALRKTTAGRRSYATKAPPTASTAVAAAGRADRP
jgi:hypothetical protein